ncbi:hypothetical protein [Rubinisphaera margarita]|uniref:hypothetical protein n=1 Tax=Rubinisphaera margarita TaxID=2909586 RepID=UPI001EE96CC0|nr:hypothetical protein [Rubinisphaera margarita]MCG6155304.1 hypothetical protein [Rubinisphaera margarita]
MKVFFPLLCGLMLLCGDGACSVSLADDREFVIVNPGDAQERYFASLRERRLFQLAELLCQRALNDSAMRPGDQLIYRLELARTFRDHAHTVPWSEAVELWQQAARTLDVRGSHAERCRFEAALLQASKLEQIFWVRQLDPKNAELLRELQTIGRRALQELADARQILDRQKQSGKLGRDEGIAGIDEEALYLALGRVHIRLAEVMRENIAERNRLLSEGRTALHGMRRSLLSDQNYLEAQLLLLIAARLENRRGEFDRLYDTVRAESDSIPFRQRAGAERVRYLLEQNRPTEAAEFVPNLAGPDGELSPQLRGLRLQALIAMSVEVRMKGNDALAEQLIQEVRARMAQLAREGHTFDAELVATELRESYAIHQFGPELAQIVRLAREAARAGNAAEARKQYEAGIAVATNQGRFEQLIELAREIAAVYFQERMFDQAASQLESIWRSSPNLPGMEQVHLLWITSLQRQYSAGPSVERLNAYAAAIADHLQRYDERESSFEARWLQAELTFARKQYRHAILEYMQFPRTHERFYAAQLRLGQCYDALLSSDATASLDVMKEAVLFGNRLLEGTDWENLQSPAHVDALLNACRLLLKYETGLHPVLPTALKHLEQRLQITDSPIAAVSEPAVRQRWLRMVTAYQGIMLARQGRAQEAMALFSNDRVTAGDASETLFLVHQLADVNPPDPQSEQILAEIQLQLIRDLTSPDKANALAPEELIALRLGEAEAHYTLGRLSQAIPIYQEVAKSTGPADPITQRLSSLLRECNNAECFGQLYDFWKGKVSTTKQGSRDWHRARLELARACLLTDRKPEAKKLVQITQLLYPTTGSEVLDRQFEELAQKLK